MQKKVKSEFINGDYNKALFTWGAVGLLTKSNINGERDLFFIIIFFFLQIILFKIMQLS